MVIWFAIIIYIPNGVLVITKLGYIPRNTCKEAQRSYIMFTSAIFFETKDSTGCINQVWHENSYGCFSQDTTQCVI